MDIFIGIFAIIQPLNYISLPVTQCGKYVKRGKNQNFLLYLLLFRDPQCAPQLLRPGPPDKGLQRRCVGFTDALNRFEGAQ